MNYYVSDTHFGHANIIKMCNRPFESVDEMDRVMIKNWNNTVSDNDHIYILGDFAYKSGNPVNILRKLNGKKHLVAGNHDTKLLKIPEVWEEFEEIADILDIPDNGKRIILCHYPLAEWPGYYRSAYHFFGHIHNNENKAQSIMSDMERAYNVGADVLGFTPRTADEIIGGSYDIYNR